MPPRPRLSVLVLAAGLLAMALVPAASIGQNNIIPKTGGCVEHQPIRITEEAGAEGFVLGPELGRFAAPTYRPGSGVIGGLGTEASPFVIEDWCITRDAEAPPLAADTSQQPAAIHIEDTDAHVVVRDNELPAQGGFETGMQLVDAQNVRVEGNDIVANTADGVRIEDGNVLHVAENRIEANGGDAVHVTDGRSADVRDNEIRDNEGAAIRYSGTIVSVAEGNTVEDNGQGIVLDGAKEILVRDNAIHDSGILDAIQLYNAKSNFIRDNHVSSTPRGIGLFSSSDGNQITGNTVENANGHAVEVSYSTGNEIDDNRIEDSQGQGIRLVGQAGTSAATSVNGNELVGNKVGLSVDETTADEVTDNAFEGNQDAGLLVSDLPAPLHAEDNWWGHASGPSGGILDACNGSTVADGDGQAIEWKDGSGVCFDPWLTVAP